VAKPGAEEAALFLGPQDLAGLGLFPPQDAGDAAAAPTVDLKKRSYRLELGVPGSRLRVVQTVLFQKGTPSVNKTVADLIAKISMSAVQDKPDVDHAHFTVGKQGCRVDTWSKDGRCYFMDLWADDGAVMEQMMVFSPPSLPDHAALGAAVDAVLDRCGAYGLKHPAGPDAAKLP